MPSLGHGHRVERHRPRRLLARASTAPGSSTTCSTQAEQRGIQVHARAPEPRRLLDRRQQRVGGQPVQRRQRRAARAPARVLHRTPRRGVSSSGGCATSSRAGASRRRSWPGSSGTRPSSWTATTERARRPSGTREMAAFLRGLDPHDHLVTHELRVRSLCDRGRVARTAVSTSRRSTSTRPPCRVASVTTLAAEHRRGRRRDRLAPARRRLVPVLFAELGVDARGPAETRAADPGGHRDPRRALGRRHVGRLRHRP